ncbi:MAG: glycoside hydrolase family 16 protein [Chitinophagaceae bacterium]|nr:glycoside hydrolase family 16 protein [Chitinophagaceae bacterium]
MRLFILLFITIGALSCAQTSKWKLVWADEFEYKGLPDSSKWKYDVGGHGWGNNELQYYTDANLNNARVDNGILTIEARKETIDSNAYTSARLVTKGKGDWSNGKIEVKAKLPKGRGTWPAIWMLASTTPLEWPDDGEIDIMEHVGSNPGYIHFTIHTKKYNHVIGTQKSDTLLLPDAMDAFHVYAVQWNEQKMEWFVDGKQVFEVTNDGTGKDAWPFNQPFHLLLNIAVGGNWGGQKGVDDSIFPQKMLIDYVRVYQLQ